MPKWDFFELDPDKLAVPLSDPNSRVTPWFRKALVIAAESKVPNPKFSKYYVNCACLVVDMITNTEVFSLVVSVPGGNIEYGLCQALHGEESLVGATSSRLSELGKIEDKDRYAVFIAFSSRFETGRVPTCCGNCRDIMRDTLSLSTMIFGGHPKGGKVIVSRLSDLLSDDFGPGQVIDAEDKFIDPWLHKEYLTLADWEASTISQCIRLENDIYSPGDLHPRRKYYAIIAGKTEDFFGAHDIMCDYHPIYAIRDAVRQVRRSNNPCFEYVVVASPEAASESGLPPDVMYKDRQHLLELNFQQECVTGIKVDPLVYLITYELVGSLPRVKKVWQTSVKRWLPYPFSPAAFGDEFIEYATKQFKKK